MGVDITMLTQSMICLLITLQAAVLAPAHIDPITRGENKPGDVNDDKVDKLIDIVKQQLEAQMLLINSLAICKCRLCDKDVEPEESNNKHPGSSKTRRRKGNILKETTSTNSSPPVSGTRTRTILAAEQDQKSDPNQILPELSLALGKVAPTKMSQNLTSIKLKKEISTSASALDTEHFTETELADFENELEKFGLNRLTPQTPGKSSRQGRRDNFTTPRRKIKKSTNYNSKVKKSTGSRTKVKKTTTPQSNPGQLSDLAPVAPRNIPVHMQRSGYWLFPHIKQKVDPIDVTQGPTLDLEVVQTIDPAQVEEESLLPEIVEDESGETDEARRGRNADQSRGSTKYDKAGFPIFPECVGDCPNFPRAFPKHLDSEEEIAVNYN